MKSFFRWFFRDKIVLPYPRIDEGSKRLGRTLSIFGLLGWSVFLFLLWEDQHFPTDVYDQLLFYWLMGLIGTWIGYRVFRGCFWVVIWVIEGFGKPKE